MSMFVRLLFDERTPNTNTKCIIVTRGKEADKPENKDDISLRRLYRLNQ